MANVRAVEKTDDAIQYEKIQPEQRIDLFDAAVFACIRMAAAQTKSKQAKNGGGKKQNEVLDRHTMHGQPNDEVRSMRLGLAASTGRGG